MLKKSKGKVRFEEEILRELKHKSIPQFIDKIEDDDFYGYVLEFKEGRTFEDIIYLDGKAFEKDEIYRISGQLIELLKYLHSKGVIHRDIRVPNTLYSGENVNLVDFGLARWINDRKYKADMDFAFLGDFLLHLYYSSFEYKRVKKKPWFDELELSDMERLFLKRLMGVEKRYCRIEEVETDFYKIIGCKP
jgi:serine/threonine-protein kinase